MTLIDILIPIACNSCISNLEAYGNEFENDTVSKLQRSISRNPHRKKNLKRALQNAFEKDKNKRKELHHKLANYLCSNFKHIIIPSYGIKTMKLRKQVNEKFRFLSISYIFKT